MFSRFPAAMALAAALLIPALVAPAAQAAEPFDFTIKAAIGGGLPHASKDAYFVTTLAGDSKDTAKVGTNTRLPFAERTKSLFDPRPQLMVGGSLDLGNLGTAQLSLDGVVGAGTVATFTETQAVIGLAGFRLVF